MGIPSNPHFFGKNYMYNTLIEEFILNFVGKKISSNGISMSALLKPLTIGSVSFIRKSQIKELKDKILYHINRIDLLIKQTTEQIMDPKKSKSIENNKIDLKYINIARSIHVQYFRRVIYWKNKGIDRNIKKFNMIQLQYERQLLNLSQSYQRMKLQNEN